MNFLLWVSGKVYWLLWPVFFILLSNTERTRVLLVCEQSVLVIKTWFGDGKWTLPGGGVHAGEDVKLGAVREVYEEVGITLDPRKLKSNGRVERRKRAITIFHVRFSTRLSRKQEPSRQWYELTHAQWVPLGEINQDNTDQAVLDHIAAWRVSR